MPECSACGSLEIEVIEGDSATGVVAPDGGAEHRHFVAIRCRACGGIEEI